MRNPFKAYWFASFQIYRGNQQHMKSYRMFSTWAWVKPKDAYFIIEKEVMLSTGSCQGDVIPIAFNRN